MKRSLIVNVVLALIVLGLGLWMTLKPGDKGPETFPVSTLKADAVDRIVIRRKGLPEFVLEKQKGVWRQTSPFPARAESSQVGRLTDLLAARSAQKLPATDLARFELDDPFATVTIGAETFVFGTVNTLTNEQYVQAGDHVYLVSPTFGYGLPTRADSLASHLLLATDEVPARIEVPGAKLERKDGKYVLENAPTGADAPSQDDLGRWMEGWRFASALTTQVEPGSPKGEAVRIGLADGRTVEFVLVSREPDARLYRPDEKLLYTLSAEQARRLLSPGGGNP
jgi:hypothetical protein